MSECVIQGLPKSSTQEVLVDGQRFATVQRHRLGHTGPTFGLPVDALAKLQPLKIEQILWCDDVGSVLHRCDFGIFAKNAKPDGDGFLSLPPSLWTSETVSNQFEHVPPSAEEVETFRKWAAELGQPSEAPVMPLIEGRDQVPVIPVKGPATLSFETLMSAVYPEPAWVVRDLLPAGLTLLAGPRKGGKSWAALQLALAVGSGGRFLGQEVKRGKALYIALEDSPRRLQDRIRRLGVAGKCDLTFATTWRPLASGGLADLRAYVVEHGTTLVVLDTIGRVLGGRIDQNSYGEMGAIMGQLQQWALSANVAVLALDHLRKPSIGGEGDALDSVVGSVAKTGTADAVWVLGRKRGERDAKLFVTGRDCEEQELAIHFDSVTMCWQPSDGVREDTIAGRILSLLKEGPRSPSSIALALNKDDANVVHELAELLGAGKVWRKRDGHSVLYGINTTITTSTTSTSLTTLTSQSCESCGSCEGVPDDDSAGPPLWDDGDDLEGSGA